MRKPRRDNTVNDDEPELLDSIMLKLREGLKMRQTERQTVAAAISICAAMLLLSAVSPALAERASLEYCLEIKADIEQLTALRRKGGTAEDMDSWKRSRRQLEQLFHDVQCRRYGRAVR